MITVTITNIRREQTRIIFFASFSDGTDKSFIYNSEWITVDEIRTQAILDIKEYRNILQEAEDKKLELDSLLNIELE